MTQGSIAYLDDLRRHILNAAISLSTCYQKFCAMLDTFKSLVKILYHDWSRLWIKLSFKLWLLVSAQSVRMANVICVCHPFKVRYKRVLSVAINVVDLSPSERIRDKC